MPWDNKKSHFSKNAKLYVDENYTRKNIEDSALELLPIYF